MYQNYKELKDYLEQQLVQKKLTDKLYIFQLEIEFEELIKQNKLNYINDLINKKIKTEQNKWGLLIFYLLDITPQDPIKELIPHKFNNVKSLPDIDLDCDSESQHLIYEYLKSNYGDQAIIPISTYVFLVGRNIIKDLCRVFDLPFKFSNEITKNLDNNTPLDESIEKIDKIVTKENKYIGEWKKIKPLIEDIGPKLEGCIRQYSTHPAGNIVLPAHSLPEDFCLPITRAKGKIQTSWRDGSLGRDLTTLGFVKYDFLGLTTLSTIKSCLSKIQNRYKTEIDPYNIDFNDQKVFEQFGKGRSDFVFQFSSNQMKNILTNAKPTSIEDLAACNALFRPGTASFIKKYIENIPYYVNDTMKEILDKSRGIILYQEQVTQIFEKIGGFSKTEAEKIKSVWHTTSVKHGKRDLKAEKRWEAIIHKFKLKAKQLHNLSEEESVKIVSDVINSIKYLFNFSHATGYSFLAYTCMFFKTYYPIEYYCSIIQTEKDRDIVNSAIKEIKKLGYKITCGNVYTMSYDLFIDYDNKQILFPISIIKGIRTSNIKKFINGRNKKPILELIEILDKKNFEILIKLECFKDIVERSNLEEIYNKNFKKGSLFKDNKDKLDINLEKEIIGFNLSKHPLEYVLELLHSYNIKTFSEINFDLNNTQTCCFLINEIKVKKTKQGKPYYKVAFEDQSSDAEAFYFSPSLSPKSLASKIILGTLKKNDYGYMISKIIKIF